MAFYRFNGTVQDLAGNVVPNASIEVRNATGSRELVPLYSDRNGTQARPNPFSADNRGRFFFHTRGGVRRIRAYTGDSLNPTFETFWDFEPMGTSQEHDVEDLGVALSAGLIPVATVADLEGVTPADEELNLGAIVLDDPDPENNGYWTYDQVGNNWVFRRGLPDTFARLTLTGASTPNALVTTVPSGVAQSHVEVFFFTVPTVNTGNVTLSIGGEPAKPVLMTDGNQFPAGSFTGPVMVYEEGDHYQTVNDPGAAAAVASSVKDFRTRWLGAYDEDPTEDAYGDPVTTGALYLNISNPEAPVLRVYGGDSWGNFPNTASAIPFRIDGDGTTGPYSLPAVPANNGGLMLFMGGIWQDTFTLDGANVTTAIPVAEDNYIAGVVLGATDIGVPSAGTVGALQISDDPDEQEAILDKLGLLADIGRVPSAHSLQSAATLNLENVDVILILHFGNLTPLAPRYYMKVAQPANVEPYHIAKFQDSNGFWFELEAGEVDRITFGAMCDWDWGTNTGTDDTAAVQGMIDYCNPFTWKGSVLATKQALYNPRACIRDSTVGDSRITSPIKLAPFVSWKGLRVGGFFTRGAGAIVADFNGKELFALDSAPWFTDGTRPLGITSTGADFDANTYSGCPGWRLEQVPVYVAPGKNLRGILNRHSSQESHVSLCHFEGGNIGIQSSSTWGGSVRDNHIRANAIGLLNNNSITTDVQENNYLTGKHGVNKPSASDFTYPAFPDAVGQGRSIGVYNRYAAPTLVKNTIEGFEIGIQAHGPGFGIRAIDNYMEVITEYCYMINNCSIHADVGYTFCGGASLVWADGGSGIMVKLDISAHRASVFEIANMGQGSAYVTTEIWGSARMPLIGTSQRISYPDRHFYGAYGGMNFGSIPAGEYFGIDISIPNLPLTATALWVRSSVPFPVGIQLMAVVTGVGTARILAYNISANAIDPPASDLVACFIDQPGFPPTLV